MSVFFKEPIRIAGLVIGRDPLTSPSDQLIAAKRAFSRGLCQQTTVAPREKRKEPEQSNDAEMLRIYLFPEGDVVDAEDNLAEGLFPRGLAVVRWRAVKGRQGQEREGEGEGDGEVATSDGGSGSRKRRRRSPLSPRPCGSSLNWIMEVPNKVGIDNDPMKMLRKCGNGSVEVTVAQGGLLQGSTTTNAAKYSRLSRRGVGVYFARIVSKMARMQSSTSPLFQLAQSSSPAAVKPHSTDISLDGSVSHASTISKEELALCSIKEMASTCTYRWWKESFQAEWYREASLTFFETPPFTTWPRADRSSGSYSTIIDA